MKKIIGLLVVSVMLVGCDSLSLIESDSVTPLAPVAAVAPVVVDGLADKLFDIIKVETVEIVEVPVYDEQDNVVGTETII